MTFVLNILLWKMWFSRKHAVRPLRVRRCGMWVCAESPVDRGITHLMGGCWLVLGEMQIFTRSSEFCWPLNYTSLHLYIYLYWAQAAHSSHNTALCLGSGVSGDFYTLVYGKLKRIEAFMGTGCPIFSSMKLSHIYGQNCAKPAMDRNAVGRSSYIFSEICTSDNCMFYGSSLPETMFKS